MMNNFICKRISCIFIFLLIFTYCHKKEVVPPQIIAQVGNESIPLEEFRSFYELDPNFGMDSTGYPALRDELFRYIDYYLSYKKGMKEGLTKDTLFVKAVNWEKRQAILRQLYREVVSSQVEISEEELRKEFYLCNINVHVKHLFSPDSSQIRQWYRQLKSGANFDSLAQIAFNDTLLSQNGGDLGWTKLGDLDEDFAQAVLALKKDQISRPVQTRWGFHIIQLLNREDPGILRDSDFNQRKRLMENRVRNRKSKELAHQFIKRYMSKINPQPVPQTFSLLWRVISYSEESDKKIGVPRVLTNKMIHVVQKRLIANLDEPLIQYNGGQITLRKFLNELKKIPISNRPRFRTLRDLSNKIGIWVRDEFLLKEARRRGIERHPRVEKEVLEFAREQTYLYYLKKELTDLKIPEEVKRYFQSKDLKILRKYPQLRHFHTLSQWSWKQAESILHKRLKLLAEDIQINEKLLREESRRIDWTSRIRMFYIRKPN